MPYTQPTVWMGQSQTSGYVRFHFPPLCLCCWCCQSLLNSAILHPVHLPSTPDQVFAAGVRCSCVYLHHKTKASSSSSLFHYPHPLRQSQWCSSQVPQYDIPCRAMLRRCTSSTCSPPPLLHHRYPCCQRLGDLADLGWNSPFARCACKSHENKDHGTAAVIILIILLLLHGEWALHTIAC